MKNLLLGLSILFSTSMWASEPIYISEPTDDTTVITDIVTSRFGQIVTTTSAHATVFVNEHGEKVKTLKSLDEFDGLFKSNMLMKIDDTRLIVMMEDEVKLMTFGGQLLSEGQLGRGKAIYTHPVLTAPNEFVVISDYMSPLTGRSMLYANHMSYEKNILKNMKTVKLADIAVSYQQPKMSADGKIIIRNNGKLWAYDVRKFKFSEIADFGFHESVMDVTTTKEGAAIALLYNGKLCRVFKTENFCVETGDFYIMAHGMVELESGDLIINFEKSVARYTKDLKLVWKTSVYPNLVQGLSVVNNTIVATMFAFNINHANDRYNMVQLSLDGKIKDILKSSEIAGIYTPAQLFGDELIFGDNQGYLRFAPLK